MPSTLDSKQNGNNYHSSLQQEEMIEVTTASIKLFSHVLFHVILPETTIGILNIDHVKFLTNK